MKIQDFFPKITESLPCTEKMPVLFVGHGSPMNALEDNAFTRSLKKLGEPFKKEAQKTRGDSCRVGALAHARQLCERRPETGNHPRFRRFSEGNCSRRTPAPGSPELAKETAKLSALIHETDDRGLDHGAWTILMHLFPEADIPVFQLSIDYYQPLQYHFDLAKQLQALRGEKDALSSAAAISCTICA